MPRKPRQKPKQRSRRKTPKCTRVSKVRHGDQFLYTFACQSDDGSHHLVQVVYRNDDKGAIRQANRQFSAYGYGRYGFGAYGYAAYGYAAYGFGAYGADGYGYGQYGFGAYGR